MAAVTMQASLLATQLPEDKVNGWQVEAVLNTKGNEAKYERMLDELRNKVAT